MALNPFEQQQFKTAGVEGVNRLYKHLTTSVVCTFTDSGPSATAVGEQAETVTGSGGPGVCACAVRSSTASSLSGRPRRAPCCLSQLPTALSSGPTVAFVLPPSQTTPVTSSRVARTETLRQKDRPEKSQQLSLFYLLI